MERILVDTLVANPEQRQALLPPLIALLSVRHGNRRISIVVAVDTPLEAEGKQCRRLRDEFLYRRSVRRQQAGNIKRQT
jgi:hypothetical protein